MHTFSLDWRVVTNSQSSMPPWLQLLDHTGDTGVIITAPDLRALFARAAWSMFAVITDPDHVRHREKVQVEVDASDRAALLVRWLSELNFRHITQHKLFSQFQLIELSDSRLTAEVYGEPIDPDRHTVYTEIKAVTFHQLEIEETATGWRTKIIFDL